MLVSGVFSTWNVHDLQEYEGRKLWTLRWGAVDADNIMCSGWFGAKGATTTSARSTLPLWSARSHRVDEQHAILARKHLAR